MTMATVRPAALRYCCIPWQYVVLPLSAAEEGGADGVNRGDGKAGDERGEERSERGAECSEVMRVTEQQGQLGNRARGSAGPAREQSAAQ